jgi:hypothetical protein
MAGELVSATVPIPSNSSKQKTIPVVNLDRRLATTMMIFLDEKADSNVLLLFIIMDGLAQACQGFSFRCLRLAFRKSKRTLNVSTFYFRTMLRNATGP